jgi:hypothetical protein
MSRVVPCAADGLFAGDLIEDTVKKQRSQSHKHSWAPKVVQFSFLSAFLLLLCDSAGQLIAQQAAPAAAPDDKVSSTKETLDNPTDVLSSDELQQVDEAVERALAWMVTQQQDDGSFLTLERGQPGVTCLSVMAFMAHGHLPGVGPYGERLERATDFILSCQKQNGLICAVTPDIPRLSRNVGGLGTNTAYNHAISSLLLSELYGLGNAPQAERMQQVIQKSLSVSLEMQRWPKDNDADKGGWRYVDNRDQSDSDLSVTGWELMFLRSARNAGFEVPKQAIDDAVAYVLRCYSKEYGTFQYWIDRGDGRSRGMAGAGILALAHAGHHNSEEAQNAAKWILKQKFEPYNTVAPFNNDRDHYHFGVFACCQGMYQVGGPYWAEFYPQIVPILLANQKEDGSWPADSQRWDAPYGSAYSTALNVMTLGAPNQLMPIFQR